MSILRTLGNLIWLLMGGLPMALLWWFTGAVAFLSIVGIPWGRACFVIGQVALLPFGRDTMSRRDLTGLDDLGTGAAGTLGNIVWFLFAGWWLALGHLGSALLCFVSIVGIPFGLQHIKLAEISLAPIGRTVVRIP